MAPLLQLLLGSLTRSDKVICGSGRQAATGLFLKIMFNLSWLYLQRITKTSCLCGPPRTAKAKRVGLATSAFGGVTVYRLEQDRPGVLENVFFLGTQLQPSSKTMTFFRLPRISVKGLLVITYKDDGFGNQCQGSSNSGRPRPMRVP